MFENFLSKNKYFVILFFIALILCREINIFLLPRLWAEEGTVHIHSIFEYGLWDSIWKPHLGYYSFLNNIIASSGILFFGLKQINIYNTVIAFVFYIASVFSVYGLKSIFWDTETKRFFVILSALAFCSGEMWMSTIYIQFYVGLFTLLFGLSNINSQNLKFYIISLAMLFLGCITGIISLLISPLFLYRFFIKDISLKKFIPIAITFLLGLFVQLMILIKADVTSEISRFSFNYFGNFFIGLGNTFINTAFMGFGSILLKIFMGFIMITLIFLCTKGCNYKIKNFIPLLYGLFLGIIFTFLSYRMFGGPRYGFIPVISIFIFLINFIFDKKTDSFEYQDIKNYFLKILIFLVFIINMVNYFDIKKFYNINWPAYNLDNLIEYPYGYYLEIFPQWSDYPEKYNYKIIITEKNLNKYREGLLNRSDEYK